MNNHPLKATRAALELRQQEHHEADIAMNNSLRVIVVAQENYLEAYYKKQVAADRINILLDKYYPLMEPVDVRSAE